MQIVRYYSAVHERLGAELIDDEQVDAATALEGRSVTYIHAGEGWSDEEIDSRAKRATLHAGRNLLRELADEIHQGLNTIADEAFDGVDAGQAAAGFLFAILHDVTERVAPEDVRERVARTIVEAAGGHYLPPLRRPKETVVRETNLETAEAPGKKSRENEGTSTHEPPASMVGLKGGVNQSETPAKEAQS